MSDEGKKPGLRDLSDLKARLGMLNKPPASRPPEAEAPANPFAPQPTPAAPQRAPSLGPGPLDLQADPDADIGGDTAIVRIGPPPSQSPAPTPPPQAEGQPFAAPAANPFAPPAANPFAPPAANPFAPPAANPFTAPPARPTAPPPAPAAPGGLDLGGDLFAAPKSAPARPAAPVAPAAAPVFADTRLASPASAPEPPAPAAGFAHPLQQGAYREAAAPVDLSASELEALESFEGKQAGIKPVMAIGMTLAVGLLTAVFGFMIGNNRSVRQRINQQIEASVMVKQRMLPILERLNEVAPIIEALAANRNKVDWAKNNAIPTDLPSVQGDYLLSTPVPLEAGLARNLARAVSDLQLLFVAITEHRATTMGRDRAELKALEEGDSFAQFQQYAVYSKPRDPKAPPQQGPPQGRVVALVGPAEQRADADGFAIPVRKRESEAPELVAVEGITLLQKTDLLGSGNTNAMTEYTKRIEALKARLDTIKPYRQVLEEQLKAQAAREKVWSL